MCISAVAGGVEIPLGVTLVESYRLNGLLHLNVLITVSPVI